MLRRLGLDFNCDGFPRANGIPSRAIRLSLGDLRDDILHYFAVDVSQAKIAARVTVGELLVIHPKQVENRRVQVVNGNPVLHRAESEFVRLAIGDAALDASASEAHSVAVGI